MTHAPACDQKKYRPDQGQTERPLFRGKTSLAGLAGWLFISCLAAPQAHAGNKLFSAKSLEFEGVAAKVTITVEEGLAGVQWINEDAAKKAYRFDVVKGVLMVTPTHSATNDHVSVVTEGGVSVTQSGSNNTVSVNVGGNDASVHVTSRQMPPLELRIPGHFPMKAKGVSGLWTVGNTGAPMEFSLNSGDAHIGNVTRAKLEIQGSGTIHTTRVDESLVATISGSGELDVKTSRLDSLDISIEGAGSVHVGGESRTARVTVQGTGDVDVERVKERPQVTVDGVGSVNIGGW